MATLTTGALLLAQIHPARADTTVNLLKNPGAEAPPGGSTGGDIDVPLWDDRTGATAVKYGARRYFPNNATPGPPSRGTSFFYGAPVANDSIFVQELDLTKYGAKIQAGGVKVNVVAWLGGLAAEPDRCDFVLVLVDANDDQVLKEVKLVGPTAAQRNNETKFLKRATTVAVPKLARRAGAQLRCDWVSGPSSDGIADGLVVKLLDV